jgi:hypothetical protein
LAAHELLKLTSAQGRSGLGERRTTSGFLQEWIPRPNGNNINLGDTTMTPEFLVQKAGLAGQNWTTVCRGPEAKAREIFQRSLKLYSIGRFRLLDPNGVILEEKKAAPLFSDN